MESQGFHHRPVVTRPPSSMVSMKAKWGAIMRHHSPTSQRGISEGLLGSHNSYSHPAITMSTPLLGKWGQEGRVENLDFESHLAVTKKNSTFLCWL